MLAVIRPRPLQLRQLMLYRSFRANSTSSTGDESPPATAEQAPAASPADLEPPSPPPASEPSEQEEAPARRMATREEAREIAQKLWQEENRAKSREGSQHREVMEQLADNFFRKKGFGTNRFWGPNQGKEYMGDAFEAGIDKAYDPSPLFVGKRRQHLVTWSIEEQKEMRRMRILRRKERKRRPTTAQSFGEKLPPDLTLNQDNLPEEVTDVGAPPVIYTTRGARINLEEHRRYILADEKINHRIVDQRYLRVTFVTKDGCSLCAPVHGIFERLRSNFRYISVSRFRQIDLSMEEGVDNWVAKYCYDIPVIIIENTTQRGRDKKHFMHRMDYDEVHEYFKSKLKMDQWPFRERDKVRFDKKQEEWEAELVDWEKRLEGKQQREEQKRRLVEQAARRSMLDEVW